MRGIFVGFGVGVAVGAGGCYLYLSAVKQSDLRRVSHGGATLEHAARRFGLPETDIVREYEGYIASYDYRTRNPKWVIEHISADASTGSATREKSEFYPDPGVDLRFSAKLSDFRGSGYDRGHMAPAANHKISQKAMDDTFSLINISPQVGAGFNRDYWARFERFVKELTRVAGDVYVVTGPLWLPTQQPGAGDPAAGGNGGGKWTLTHDWIGKPPGLVAVPTHYYKVVVADPRAKEGRGNADGSGRSSSGPLPQGSVAVGAFVMPNQSIDPRVPLSAYVVPLEDLEQVAGTSFFPELLGDSRRRTALDTAAVSWRQQGMSQLKPFERVTMKEAYAALPATTGTTSTITIDVEGTSKPATTTSSGSSSSSSSMKATLPAPKTPAGTGVMHVCDVNACNLPPMDFYLRGRGGRGGGKDEA